MCHSLFLSLQYFNLIQLLQKVEKCLHISVYMYIVILYQSTQIICKIQNLTFECKLPHKNYMINLL